MGEITKLFFCDTETGGLDDAQHDIVEIAACLADPKTLAVDPDSVFHCLIKPERELTDFTRQKFADVIALDWAGAITLDDALATLGPLMVGATWVGQNPAFDKRFLQRAFAATGRQWPEMDYHVLDTASMVYPLVRLGLLESVSLKSSRVTLLGYRDEQGHRAVSDMLDTVDVFAAMCNITGNGADLLIQTAGSLVAGLRG